MWLRELILPLIVLALAIQQIRSDSRITRSFAVHSIIAAVGYLSFAVLGVLVLFAARPEWPSDGSALFAIIFWLCWLAYGTVWLIRLAPRLREPPHWLLRPFGIIDWILIVVGAATFLAFIRG